ncbi:copper transport protein ctr1, partial [Actinomortierella ambigua]
SGGYGSVHHAHWGNQPCAAKQFFLPDTEHGQSSIQNEVSILSSLRHRHIIQFYGTVRQDGRLFLVMDIAEGGSLTHAIQSRSIDDWDTKHRIAHEIARGLEFIHEEGVLHRDLKSGNVLLNKYMEVKLCDFGISEVKQMEKSRSYGNQVGTVRWMAPELFSSTPIFTSKSDMYSFGMVMWEMAANCTRPFETQVFNEVVKQFVLNGHREKIPEDTPVQFREFIVQCWSQDPIHRPDASEALFIATEQSDGQSTDEIDLSFDRSSFLTMSLDVTEGEGIPVVDLDELERKAGQDDIEAQFELAERHLKGDDGVEDAFFWYLRAARQNHPKSQLRLGEMYSHGYPTTPKCYTVAALWFRRAADQGFADAQFSLAWMYAKGNGVDKSPSEAADWCRLAAEQGLVDAQHFLANMYLKGQGLVQSFPDAVEWYRKAAEQDDAKAQFALGTMLRNGQGVDMRDDIEAAWWFAKATAQQHEGAKSALQSMCRREPTLVGVLEYLPQAEDAGTRLCVGQALNDDQEVKDQGIGVVEWYRMSTKLAMARAQNNLGWMYDNGRGTEKNGALAVELYHKAALQGESTAQFNLGVVTEEGRGDIQKDLVQAIEWYRKAADQSNLYALNKMAALKIHGTLGTGNFGKVYKAEYEGSTCAAKCIFLTATEYNKQTIANEISILKRLQNPNIIQFLGVQHDGTNLFIITAWAERGSLKKVIDSGKLKKCWRTKTRIAHQIARGLQYIHSQEIRHRDLKSDNVLLTKSMDVKLCDFGLAEVKQLSVSRSNAATPGTLRWMAPELLAKRPTFSRKSDMYAFGMVMWEMAANCSEPFKTQTSIGVVMELVRNGDREDIPDDTPEEFRRWIELCWHQDPDLRPHAHEIVFTNVDTQQDEDSVGDLSPGSDSDDDLDKNSPNSLKYGIVDIGISTISRGTTLLGQAWGDGDLDDVKTLMLKARNHDVRAQVALAAKYEKGEGLEQSDYEAFVWYYQAANQGDAGAQLSVAQMFLDGRGVLKSELDASKWFHEAAANGCSQASRCLGIMYGEGQGVGQDAEKAATLYRTAAEAGDTDARHLLGDLYRQGRGVERSDDEAVLYYRQAAGGGHIGALLKLGQMYRLGDGIPKDDSEAFQYFLEAAKHDSVEAQYHVGMMYQAGEGVDKSDTESSRWLLVAAEQGHVEAQFSVGLLYETGRGVGQDDAEAVSWYNKAADGGHPMAQFSLGLMHRYGYGVKEKSDTEAARWFLKAANQGHPDAQFCLGLMLQAGGQGVEADKKEALSWLLKAAKQGHASAQYQLGMAYFHGEIAEQSDTKAIEWLRKAAGEADDEAQTEADPITETS